MPAPPSLNAAEPRAVRDRARSPRRTGAVLAGRQAACLCLDRQRAADQRRLRLRRRCQPALCHVRQEPLHHPDGEKGLSSEGLGLAARIEPARSGPPSLLRTLSLPTRWPNGRSIVFQMAEVMVPRDLLQKILGVIAALRLWPPPAVEVQRRTGCQRERRVQMQTCGSECGRQSQFRGRAAPRRRYVYGRARIPCARHRCARTGADA